MMTTAQTESADQFHLAPLELIWSGVRPAAEAVGLAPHTLLHAGPPFRDATAPSAVVLSSAVVCILHEGWAQSEAEAEALIRNGGVQLRPSLQYGVSIPLAGVISPSTALLEVRDRATGACYWSLLHSGNGVEIRFGSRHEQLQERMRYRDRVLAPAFHARLQQAPVALAPIAAAALAAGDDLHADTSSATRLLAEGLQTDDPQLQSVLAETPTFFLTLWMACAMHYAARLCRQPDIPGDTLVAIAGNGETIGMRCASNPDLWLEQPGRPPQGMIRDAACAVANGVGDSGVIDAIGCGAQLWLKTARVLQAMPMSVHEQVHRIDCTAVGRLSITPHLTIHTAYRLGLLREEQSGIYVSLAMLERQGVGGLLGRGVLRVNPPHAPEPAAQQ